MIKKIILAGMISLIFPMVVWGGYVDHGNGTVTDTDTGLMWQKDTAPGTYTWEQALSYCESSTLAGYNDWRLPNRNELQSIVDYSRYNPSINTTFFPNTQSSYYWSSTTSAGYPYSAWYVYFDFGFVYFSHKSNFTYVRAVRGGQCGSFGLSVPLLNQRDYDQRLGTCSSTVASAGCAVTCLTMVMQYYNVNDLEVHQKDPETGLCTGTLRIGVDPEIVDDWLTCHGAYEDGCLMGHNWTILPPGVKASSRHDNSYFSLNPPGISPQTYSFIDTALANQHPVIAWIKDPHDADFTHFVVIRGRTDDTYYINDPWNGVVTTLEDGELGNYLSDKAIFSCREFYKDSDYDNVPDVDENHYGISNSGYASEPVNTALGNYTYEHTDLKFSGRGMPFEFKRAYNSLDSYNGPLGHGWTHSYNISVNEYESAAVVKWGDGHEDVYNEQGGSFVPALPGINDTIVKNGDDTFTLTRKDQTQYQFDTSGKLTSIEDKNGNTITLTYDVDGNLTTITDTVERNITLTYDAQNRVTLITDPLSRTIGYLYDVNGDLIKVTDARSGETEFEYDTEHRITSITLPRDNTLLENSYDTEGRVVSQTNGRGYITTFAYDTPSSNQTTVTDPLSNSTIHTHDTSHRLLEVKDALGNDIEYTYDSNSNRTEIVDKNGNTTSYFYDSKGNVTSKTDALGKITTITYDSKNNPLTRTDALEKVTTYTYDSNGNLTSILDALSHTSSITYDSYGQPLTITDANGNTTTNTYDDEGNLTEIEDDLNNTTTFTYDDVGRKLSVTDANTHTTSFTYDNNDNLLTITDPLTGVITYAYDANDNRASVTDPKGNTTTYVYNANDLLTSITDELDNVTSYTYNELDKKATTTDARGNITHYTYDAVGNLTQVKDALNNITTYAYDANGNMLSMTNAKGKTTSYTYDALNRLTKVTDPLGNSTENTYDALGRLTQVKDAKGNITSYTYDALGRLTKVTDALSQETVYGYDNVGNRTSITDAKGNTTTFSYNEVNRLIGKTDPMLNSYSYSYDGVGNRISLTDANGITINYSYDDNNRLTTITYPDLSTVSFTYDKNGNRTQMVDPNGTTTYQYDELNRMESYTDAYGKTIGYSYDEVGNRLTLTYPGNKVVNYTYDALNRISTVTDWLSGITTYTYDATSNVSQIANPNSTSVDYSYDNSDRLITLINKKSDTTTIASYNFTLDKLGNHTKVLRTSPLDPDFTPGLENYTYDDDNRMTSVDTTTYSFDDNGNMTGNSAGDLYAYDYEDRLLEASRGGVTSHYTYDGVGNRIARIEDSVTTKYVLDVNGALTNVLVETDGSGNIQAYYVYGLGLISRIKPDDSVQYYHFDSRGSTVALTDATQAISDKYDYDDFGNLSNSEGTTSNPFKYVGRFGVMDEGNGLQYMRARYYDAGVGRFLNKDIIQLIGNSQFLNEYSYALNNPIYYIDADGNSILLVAIGIGVITYAIVKPLYDWMSSPEEQKMLDKAIEENEAWQSDDLQKQDEKQREKLQSIPPTMKKGLEVTYEETKEAYSVPPQSEDGIWISLIKRATKKAWDGGKKTLKWIDEKINPLKTVPQTKASIFTTLTNIESTNVILNQKLYVPEIAEIEMMNKPNYKK